MARSRKPADLVSYPWDLRGLFLTTLDMSFFAKALPGRWRRIVAELGLQEDAPATVAKFPIASFVALPEPVEKDALYLSGGVHPGPNGEGDTLESAHWHLAYELAPASVPPARLQEQSARVGGYPAFLETLCDKWPSDEKTIDVVLNATYMVKDLRLRPVLTKAFSRVHAGTVRGAEGELKLTPKATATVWNVEPPSGPIRRLTISSVGRHIISIAVSGERRLHLSVSIRQEIDQAIWVGLQPFLEA